jgi:N-acyl-D-amino-acid deacylase
MSQRLVIRGGRVAVGHFTDVAVFDPEVIADHATYDRPHRYATGVAHVLVNGVPQVRDGACCGHAAGRARRRGAA